MVRILVGVAWPYSNGPQHLGHLAGNLLPADIFARYHRLAGHEVVMVSGSDMHGTPTTVKAEAEGVQPSVIAERYHRINDGTFQRLGLSFDTYTTTHTALHARTAQGMFLTLLQNGYIEKRTAQGAFCPKHQRFLPDRYVTGTCPTCGNPNARGDECPKCSRVLEPQELKEPRCKTCGTPAEFRPTEHFYLLLPKLTEKLQQHHREAGGRWRPSVRAFTENYVKDGLRARPITRDLAWGVPLPLDGYPDKRLYVWFEAVIGYLSATQEWSLRQGTPDAWKRFWLAGEDSRVYQFMGKDNITFHTVIWPAILLGVGGFQLPYDVPANEFLNFGGEKLSKSETDPSTSVFLPDLVERFTPDTIRFYASYHAPENHDTEFEYGDLSQDHDQILADQWGNLVHRVLSFIVSNYGGQVPAPPADWSPASSVLGNRIRVIHRAATIALEAVHEKEALDLALGLAREGNRFVHDAKPWAQKGPDRDRSVYEALWAVKALDVLLAPFIPFSCEKLAAMLGIPDALRPGRWEEALVPPVPGRAVGPVSPLFTKLLAPSGPGGGRGGGAAPPAAAPTPSAPPPPSLAPPDLEIRVGTVLKVELHPKADKLYVLSVDLGESAPRTLVAGLRPHYKPEELEGKRVAVLANLEPRPLRGVTSQGMVLAADDGKTVAVLTAPPATPPGTRLKGATSASAVIAHETFARAQLVVGRPATTSEGSRTVDVGSGPLPVPGGGGATGPPELTVARLDRHGPGRPEVLELEDGSLLSPDRPLPPGSKVR